MRTILLTVLLLAGCGEAVQDNHFADDVREARAASEPVVTAAVPVRIGELGPNFPACNAAGTTRNLAAGGSLAVRAAPFDTAPDTARIPAGGRFFICSRSHDQKWFGLVFGEGASRESCGIAAPVAARRAYDGPCQSGWVAAPFVRFNAGADSAQIPQLK